MHRLHLAASAYTSLSGRQVDDEVAEVVTNWTAAAHARINSTHLPAAPIADTSNSVQHVRSRQRVTFQDARDEADEVMSRWKADLEQAAFEAEKKELDRVDALLTPVADFLNRIADGKEVCGSAARPSLLGDQAIELTADQARELARLVSNAATYMCDPTKVARNPAARHLPYRATLAFRQAACSGARRYVPPLPA